MVDSGLKNAVVESTDYRDILRLIDSRLPLPLVYAGCRLILQRRMPADNFYICLLEKDGLRFPYYIDEKEPESQLDIFPKSGWTAFVIDTEKRYWLMRDPKPGDAYSPVGPIPHDWIGVPIVDRGNTLLGVFTVQTYRQNESYSDADVEFLYFVADAVSLAIQLSMQDREITTRRIAALVDETLDSQNMYEKIHESMQGIIPAARKNFIIAKVDERRGVFRPVFWLDEKDDFGQTDLPLYEGFGGYIYGQHRKSYIYVHGVSAVLPEMTLFGTTPEYWLGAPLFSKDRIIGIVAIQSYNAGEIITKEDEYALNGVCPFIANALSHTELFSRLKSI